MRKVGWITACLAILLSALTVSLYRRFQIEPLPGYPFGPANQHPKRVENATSLFCSHWAEHPVSRVVLIHLVQKTRGTRPSISINEDETGNWSEAQQRLASIYATRADRTVYVVEDSNIDQRYRTELMDMLRRSPVIEDVCVIDPKNPPSWYPPQRVVMPRLAQL